MACSSGNLITNGGFRDGLSSWQGRGIETLPNPIRPKDTSVRIDKGGILFQNVSGTFIRTCAYYLYFSLLNENPRSIQPRLFAVVSWMDKKKHLLRTTPLLVIPPRPNTLRFTSYFAIVPPPPKSTAIMSVVFLTINAPIVIDNIVAFAKDVGSPRSVHVKPQLIEIPF
ncbi:hypothetical protein SAMN05444487_10618 [Marininema mesophilum]|uniref:Uncharacterized protein n=1 Tax=Marininema mesophilum TaxID=1048340 RepID=A0A1H2W4W7_9BACL|nr:hypothetical protein [Marininema mesophilum]SDW75587.1 hypothetical protein SAMN05444487_10618 [Marininema mesophilum]